MTLPSHFDVTQVGEIWRVSYGQRAIEAKNWALEHEIAPATTDHHRTCLLLIDVQNTFCLPDFELFVGGQSGRGAIEDNQRLCEFIYRHLGNITQIVATLDTHTAMQIFHPIFWINAQGNHPTPAATQITLEEVKKGVWKPNPALAPVLFQGDEKALENYALHYTQRLSDEGKYPLTVWPYHSMLGGIGHALVPSVEEALFFHTIARNTQTRYELKGNHPLTENYSVLQPEVLEDHQGKAIATKNTSLIQDLLTFDRILVAGQAKSHCVAWTVADLLQEIQRQDPSLAQKVYLLEDCMSSVVVPGVVDYTPQAEALFAHFEEAGMHRVQSITVLS